MKTLVEFIGAAIVIAAAGAFLWPDPETLAAGDEGLDVEPNPAEDADE